MRRIPGLAALAALALASPALANKSAEAQAAFAVGRDADALRLYEEAIAEAGGDPTALAIAYSGRGEVQALNRRYDDAIADFSTALALPLDEATRASTLIARADAYARKRMVEEALADYGESLKLVPGAPGVHVARANLYRRQDKKAEALAEYEAELKINPKSFRALSGRADLLGLPQPESHDRGGGF
jgi:tetratricopeptide (TPR) repeat protein